MDRGDHPSSRIVEEHRGTVGYHHHQGAERRVGDDGVALGRVAVAVARFGDDDPVTVKLPHVDEGVAGIADCFGEFTVAGVDIGGSVADMEGDIAVAPLREAVEEPRFAAEQGSGEQRHAALFLSSIIASSSAKSRMLASSTFLKFSMMTLRYSSFMALPAET